MYSMLVIGLGRFGVRLAQRLAEMGNEVLAIDKNQELVDKIVPFVTRAQSGDCMNEDVLRELGVSNFDVCFVCISEDFQSSLEITSLLKELGAPKVVSKTDRDIHAKFLRKIGADEVVYPERDMANRTAAHYSAKGAFDYIELTPEYSIYEIEAPKSWVGKSLIQLNLRNKFNISVIGIKKDRKVIPVTNAERVFEAGEHILLAGENKNLIKTINRA